VTATALMEQYLAAARAGDLETAFGFVAEDVRVRIPGRSAMAGEHQGRDVVVEYIRTARERSHGADVELEVIDMLASRERVALILNERFHTADGPVDIRRANVYRVVDGQIVEVWIYEGDQYAVDALLA
jgi:ketosteroid isomerase-like protein